MRRVRLFVEASGYAQGASPDWCSGWAARGARPPSLAVVVPQRPGTLDAAPEWLLPFRSRLADGCVVAKSRDEGTEHVRAHPAATPDPDGRQHPRSHQLVHRGAPHAEGGSDFGGGEEEACGRCVLGGCIETHADDSGRQRTKAVAFQTYVTPTHEEEAMSDWSPSLPLGVGLYDEQGRWERPVQVTGWSSAVEVRLTGTDLAYKGLSKTTTVALQPDLLERFVGLADADDMKIKAFVERHGPLGLCAQHGLPHGFAPRRVPPADDCPPHKVRTYREPVDGYRLWANQAKALIEIADAVGRRIRATPVRQRDWPGGDYERLTTVTEADRRLAVPLAWWTPLEALFVNPSLSSLLHMSRERDRPLPLADEQRLLAHCVNAWLQVAEVRPVWGWPERSALPVIEVGGGHLFGWLAFDLATRTTRATRVPICVECGKPIVTGRRSDDRRYCDVCRPKAMKRDQARRRRQKEREARDGQSER